MDNRIPAGVILPVIPETVVVHLGPADQEAPNIEIGFIDYIANVASNEIYPTWPENAIIANIIAQISFTLNRIYTEYYRSRGYDFDITSSTAVDQSFNPAGSVFENVRALVEENFDGYIRRNGNVEPLFALYCDGVNTTCAGLSQVGSVSLAESGLTPIEILQRYYGNDIEYVTDVPIESYNQLAPDVSLQFGSVGNFVKLLQTRLNRISGNYPAIPKISEADGIYGRETEEAVKVFQKIFGLTVTGITDKATWYKVNQIFNGVKKLNELISEGLNYEDVSLQYPEELSLGDSGVYVSIIQYYLNFVSAFTTDFTDIPINGVFDEVTKDHVIDFQNYAGLPATGVMDEQTWNALFDAYFGIVNSLPESSFEGIAKPFPGITIHFGDRGDDVRTLQEYINVLAGSYPEIPEIPVDAIFGEMTRDAVYAIQSLFNLTVDGKVDALTWAVIADEYNVIVAGETLQEGQYPGYEITVEEEIP